MGQRYPMGIWHVSVAGNTQIAAQRAEEARVVCGAAHLIRFRRVGSGATILVPAFLQSCLGSRALSLGVCSVVPQV